MVHIPLFVIAILNSEPRPTPNNLLARHPPFRPGEHRARIGLDEIELVAIGRDEYV